MEPSVLATLWATRSVRKTESRRERTFRVDTGTLAYARATDARVRRADAHLTDRPSRSRYPLLASTVRASAPLGRVIGETVEQVHFGWFIPTSGDTSAFGVPSAQIAPSLELFVEVARAAERAGFEYALVPVQTMCWEAYMTCAMVAARTERIKLLLAARPGFVSPTVMAKMISTFDQLSGGRVYVNLIAGGGYDEMAADGDFHTHDERYAIMDETVTIMKRVWTEAAPVTHEGTFFKVEKARVVPRPFQQPHPPFYLGGISAAAREVCAKHADVYLFWGDTTENIAPRIADARSAAARYGREDELRFGMRLQLIVREKEEDAWAFARDLIANASEHQRSAISRMWEQSESNSRMKVLAQADDFRIAPHLWSGISSVRLGAGVAIVGNPQQVAETIQQFVDIGCTEFCLSGYPHAEEAERFGRLVLPYFADHVAQA